MAAASNVLPQIGVRISMRTSPNARMVIPQTRYPPQINSFRLPTQSDSAPTRIVVRAAATELAPTIMEISAAEA